MEPSCRWPWDGGLKKKLLMERVGKEKKIHFENENVYFGNWNIISDIKIMLKIKISFNVWSAHWRNWDFYFGNHFEKVPFGDVNLNCRSQKSHFENFSWKLKFDLKVQKSYFGNHNLVLGNQKFHFDSQKVISKFSFSPLDARRKNPIVTFTIQAYSKRFIWNRRSIMTLISRHQFFFAPIGWFLRREHFSSCSVWICQQIP